MPDNDGHEYLRDPDGWFLETFPGGEGFSDWVNRSGFDYSDDREDFWVLAENGPGVAWGTLSDEDKMRAMLADPLPPPTDEPPPPPDEEYLPGLEPDEGYEEEDVPGASPASGASSATTAVEPDDVTRASPPAKEEKDRFWGRFGCLIPLLAGGAAAATAIAVYLLFIDDDDSAVIDGAGLVESPPAEVADAPAGDDPADPPPETETSGPGGGDSEVKGSATPEETAGATPAGLLLGRDFQTGEIQMQIPTEGDGQSLAESPGANYRFEVELVIDGEAVTLKGEWVRGAPYAAEVTDSAGQPIAGATSTAEWNRSDNIFATVSGATTSDQPATSGTVRTEVEIFDDDVVRATITGSADSE